MKKAMAMICMIALALAGNPADAYAYVYNISHSCADGCLTGTTVTWNVTLYKGAGEAIEVSLVEIRKSGTEEQLGLYNATTIVSTKKSFLIDGTLPAVKQAEYLNVTPCFTTMISQRNRVFEDFFVGLETTYCEKANYSTPNYQCTTASAAADAYRPKVDKPEQCALTQACVNNTCAEIECGECQYISNHGCLSHGCCDDTACSFWQKCQNNTCQAVSCLPGYKPENHSCAELSCNENEAVAENSCVQLGCASDETPKNHTCIRVEPQILQTPSQEENLTQTSNKTAARAPNSIGSLPKIKIPSSIYPILETALLATILGITIFIINTYTHKRK